jgi:peptidoglycan hydrolase-like protein with peptidoglycan-binding domain
VPATELSSPAVRRPSRPLGRRAAVAGAAFALAAAGGIGSTALTGVAAAKSRSSSGTVAAVQRVLGVPADGIMGPVTRRAVKRFQRRHHLTVDGVIGPQTLGALKLGSRAPSSNRTFETAANAGGGDDTLARIAACESGGNPRAISADGRYRGKYQFTRETWRAMGGTGDPARASEFTQDQMAAKLLASRGTAPWPACSAQL